MTTTARVIVTLDIESGSSWGDECQISQVKEQAIEGAIGRLNQLINSRELKATIVGRPKVTVVMHNTEEK